MDRTTQEQQEIERLIRVGAEARTCLAGEVVSLKARLDVPSRLRGSLKSHPAGWLFGSVASGLAASLLFRRKSSQAQKKPRGLILTLIGLILTVLRPTLKVWLTDQLKNYLIGQFQGRTATHPALRKSNSPNII